MAAVRSPVKMAVRLRACAAWDSRKAGSAATRFIAVSYGGKRSAAPRFAGTGTKTCDDKLAPGEIGVACTGNDWRGGGPGVGVASVTTYDVIDELVRRFADKKRYPRIENIVLMGHSAGGQFLSRYAAAAKMEPAGVAVRYVVSNPSSYLYPDETRPGPTQGCVAFNQWKYGMENRTGYAAGSPMMQGGRTWPGAT